jgi:hypothetical protein
MEVVVSAAEAGVDESVVQFLTEKSTHKINQILCRETENVCFFSVRAKVISVEDAVMVRRPPNKMLKQEVQLDDETGLIITLVF